MTAAIFDYDAIRKRLAQLENDQVEQEQLNTVGENGPELFWPPIPYTSLNENPGTWRIEMMHWNCVLTADEFKALHDGIDPRLVRPDAQGR